MDDQPYIKYEELSMTGLERLDCEHAVVLFPLGPLEEHGPHLPFGVDAFNADYVATDVARIIRDHASSIPVVKLPLFYLGTKVYRKGGSLRTRQRVLRDLLYDYGISLRNHGFRRLILIGAHGGPHDMVAFEEAARTLSRKGLTTISLTSRLIFNFLSGQFVNKIAKRLGSQFSEEDRKILKQDYHAGWWETSMMLWLYPHLVDPGYRELPATLVPHTKLWNTSPWEIGPGLGYMGAPAKASAEFAEAAGEVLREDIIPLIRSFLAGELTQKKLHSPLYYLPIFRTNFWRWVGAAGLIAGIGVVYLLLRAFEVTP